MILDEPTNDLDIDTIELLEDYVDDFAGVVVIVSHDRAFLDSVCKTTLAFGADGHVNLFPGNYGEYRQALADEAAEAAAVATNLAAAARLADKSASADKSGGLDKTGSEASAAGRQRARKPSFAEKKEYDGILAEIDALEAEKAALEAVFVSGVTALEQATARYQALGHLIDSKTERWAELADLIEWGG